MSDEERDMAIRSVGRKAAETVLSLMCLLDELRTLATVDASAEVVEAAADAALAGVVEVYQWAVDRGAR